MATINFLYRSTKDKAFLNVRLLYRHNNNDFALGAKTKFEIEFNNWFGHHAEIKDNKNKGIKAIKIKGTKDQAILNKRLDVNNELNKIENHILKAFNSVNPDEVSKEWLQTQIDNYYNPSTENDHLPTEFLKYFDFFIDCKKNEITTGTHKKYHVTKHLIERYQKERNTKLNIIDVNYKFKVDFEKYCLDKNYALNTISKDLRTIKTVCNHARQNGLEVSNQLENIKTPQYKTEKIYLTFEDIEKIENIDARRLNDNYENAKDWLIISCYTGQRISDFMRFNKSMIRYERNKQGELKPLLEFTQVKTDKVMTIALHPKVIEILDKRDGNFPKVISDAKYNYYIKQVCRIAELNDIIKGSKLVNINIDKQSEKRANNKDEAKQYRKETGMYKKWKLVSSHIGRRSFATNFYGNIPTTYLINVTGHSTEAMFLNYIGKSNKDLALEITSYF